MSHLYYTTFLADAPKYIFKGVENDSDLVFVPDFMMQPHSFVRKVLKFLLIGRFPIGGRWVEQITGFKGYQWLTTLQPGDRILLNGVVNLNTLRAVKWLLPNGVRPFQYFNNCLRFVMPQHKVARRVKAMQEMGYNLLTFDPEEAAQYGMTYAPQFFRFPEPWKEEICYDFFFCGMAKDRIDRLQSLKSQLEAMGFTCKFIIVGRGHDDKISYEQYLDYVKKSRCLVDMFQNGQIGLTRRPLEALFFNKKLLTENTHVADFDFYRQENTFIIGRDNWDDIKCFMDDVKPVTVPDEVKQRYDVKQWLQHFK